MIIVIDTNVLVSALSLTSKTHWVIEGLMAEQFVICVTTDILLEYEEILTQKYGAWVAQNFLKALEEMPNVRKIEVFFQWNLLNDPDDNKFVDAAIAGNVAYIVSEDRDFRVLNNIEFPKVAVLRVTDFQQLYSRI